MAGQPHTHDTSPASEAHKRAHSWSVLGIVESPVLGPEGNKEFLIAARREAS